MDINMIKEIADERHENLFQLLTTEKWINVLKDGCPKGDFEKSLDYIIHRVPVVASMCVLLGSDFPVEKWEEHIMGQLYNRIENDDGFLERLVS